MADTEQKDPEGFDNRPTSQIDLERRLANDFRPETVKNTDDNWANPEVVQASHVIEGNDTSAFRGVSPEYMNYASEEGKPYEADTGPEAENIKRLSTGVAQVRKTVPPEDTEPAVGVTGTQTVYTATSGENYSAELVDAPPEPLNYGPPAVMPADTQPTDDAPATTTTKASAAPAKKTAAAPAKSSTNS